MSKPLFFQFRIDEGTRSTMRELAKDRMVSETVLLRQLLQEERKRKERRKRKEQAA